MISGCASAPRAFTPQIASRAPDAAFSGAFDRCSAQVAAGKRDQFKSGRAGSVAGGVAIGGAAALATGSSAASGAGMLSGVAGGIGFGLGLVVFAPLAIYGVSRARRAAKERDIQAAMTTCLAAEGYTVERWSLARGGAGAAASPTKAGPP